MIEPLISPWGARFDEFVKSIKDRAMIVAPYITKEGLNRLRSRLESKRPPRIDILTALNPNNMASGSLDVRALANLCGEFPEKVAVRSLLNLHAKVYIADEHCAIVTSGNFTRSSLAKKKEKMNYEYGIRISKASLVKRIATDMRVYSALGEAVSVNGLNHTAQIIDEFKKEHRDALKKGRAIRTLLVKRFNAAFVDLHAPKGKSKNAILANSILRLLTEGSMTTEDIYSGIEKLHPDFSKDTSQYESAVRRYGLAWQRYVRIAQQHLKKKGIIEQVGGRNSPWRLVFGAESIPPYPVT